MRDEPIWRAFCFDLRSSLTKGQCLGLGEDIGKQHVMMPTQRIEWLDERDEIARYEPRTLMDQLIKGMLAVGARLTPIDRPRIIVDCDPVDCHMLAIALHGQLLEIGWKTLQILLIRQHGNSLRREEIIVPHAEEPHQNRQVVLKWRR